MNTEITTNREGVSLLPLPMREDVNVRVAKESDLPFIDALQKKHSRNVGWMAMIILQKKIVAGDILIAEEVRGQRSEISKDNADPVSSLTSDLRPLTSPPTPIGYLLGQDRYFKRDDVGIVYQLNVVPGNQRGLVGASLLKAQFEKSAYGCKLYCCWCAQDLAANKFWEAMGFVPLAFRAGSRGKRRVHIFWQRRIRAGDETTPYWFPSQTGAGALKEDRIVLPIPPGTHWSEVRPTVLPTEEFAQESKPREKRERKAVVKKPQMAALGSPMWFAPAAADKAKVQKVKEPKKKVKNDPKLVAAARELRDRWLEEVNGPGGERLLVGNGKYDVSRQLAQGEMEVQMQRQVKQIEVNQVRALAA